MEYDDKVRDKKGVVVCLRDMGNGTSRLFFDDVITDRDANPITWSHDAFHTFTPEFENAGLRAMTLSSSDFEKIGIAVVTRLLASTKRSP